MLRFEWATFGYSQIFNLVVGQFIQFNSTKKLKRLRSKMHSRFLIATIVLQQIVKLPLATQLTLKIAISKFHSAYVCVRIMSEYADARHKFEYVLSVSLNLFPFAVVGV